MKLPKELTTVTPLSKYLAMLVFIIMPFIGFFYGMQYQETLDLIERQQMETNLLIHRAPTPTPLPAEASVTEDDITANWKTYTIPNILTFKYPQNYIVKNTMPHVFSIADKEESFGPAQTSILIDTRMTGIAADYNKNISQIVGNKEQLTNGIKTTNIGTINGKQTMRYTNIYYKYKEGAIIVVYGDDLAGSRLYDQILQTFKFTQ